MAGIGFELKKLFHRKGLVAMVRAYGYAGVICTGPMLLGILLQFGVLAVSGSGKRQLRTLNKQLEDILVRNKDMESLLQHLNTRYSIAYVVNLRADTQRPVVVPGYVQKMLDKHGGSFHEMLLDYCDKLVAPAYRDGFRMLFDYDYVRDRICREGAIRYAYVRNDGERFLITIFPDTHSVDEVMWVFAKEDTSSEE